MPRGTFVHLHIPKCGGTTVNQYVMGQYGSANIFNTDGKREHGVSMNPITVDCGYSGDFVQQVQSSNHPLIVGHLPYGIHRKVGKVRADNMLYFCVLRHPVFRVWSLYKMQRRNSVYKLRPYLDKYNDNLRETLLHTPPEHLLECHNDQMRMVLGSAKFNFEQSDLDEAIRLIEEDYFYVTILEQLEERKPEIKKLFGFGGNWNNLNVGRKPNTGGDIIVNPPGEQPKGYNDNPDEETWNLILEKNRWDLALFEHVKARGGLVGRALKELSSKTISVPEVIPEIPKRIKWRRVRIRKKGE